MTLYVCYGLFAAAAAAARLGVSVVFFLSIIRVCVCVFCFATWYAVLKSCDRNYISRLLFIFRLLVHFAAITYQFVLHMYVYLFHL